jgi:Etoposide-induced protein 2.4 (EI24)
LRYAAFMNPVFDAFWRAAAYCLHPRVIALSFLPLAIMAGLTLGLSYFFWQGAVDAVAAWLQSSAMLSTALGWLDSMGLSGIKTAIAPLLITMAATPFIVVGSLLLVALLMSPSIVALVAERRFHQLERKKGGSLLASVAWSFSSSVLAMVALCASVPLWLIPPLILIVPPLIWGWLTYRVMVFDALADHASAQERRAIFKAHRSHLLVIGIVGGYLGAAPGLIWASGTLFAVMFFVLVPLAIWIYTLVFAFTSLWFTHYCLAALEKLRADALVAAAAQTPSVPAWGAAFAAGAAPADTDKSTATKTETEKSPSVALPHA